MYDLQALDGTMAVITEASDAIGRAITEALATQGFDLALVARRKTVLAGVARDLDQRHGISVQVLALGLRCTRSGRP